MNRLSYDIISYTEAHNEELLRFERGITQGTHLTLEIIKEHFLSRARVFEKSYAGLAIDDQKKILGTAIAAETTLEINGELVRAGFGLDAKVAVQVRKKGVGRKLAKEMYRQFFSPNGLTNNFFTAKLTNAPILKVTSGILTKIWLYDFLYLTIPTLARIKATARKVEASDNFRVSLFDQGYLPREYYTHYENGLGCFHTHRLYKLKIRRIGLPFKLLFALLKILNPSKFEQIPDQGDEISFSTLYNHSANNIADLNPVLEDLQQAGIKHLMVCCRKGDQIHQSIKNLAIYTYRFTIVTDFQIDPNDRVAIDVRCL